MLTEYELVPLIWVKEITGMGITDLRWNLRQDSSFKHSLQYKMYLLQEVVGAGLQLDFKWQHQEGVYSTGLLYVLGETLAPLQSQETSQHLADYSLKDASKAKIETFKELTEPPEHWTGDCEPVWLKGEASLLYISRNQSREPIQTFRDRAIAKMFENMPEIPKPLVAAAYERLGKFEAFRLTQS